MLVSLPSQEAQVVLSKLSVTRVSDRCIPLCAAWMFPRPH